MHNVMTFLPIIVIFAAFYFLMIRPQQKKQKQYKAMLGELKVNDKILTRGGIIGKITKISENELLIESEGTRLRISKEGINTKLDK